MAEELKSLRDIGVYSAEMNELPLMVETLAFKRDLKKRFNKWRKKYSVPKTEEQREILLKEGAEIIAEIEKDMPRVKNLAMQELGRLAEGINRMLL